MPKPKPTWKDAPETKALRRFVNRRHVAASATNVSRCTLAQPCGRCQLRDVLEKITRLSTRPPSSPTRRKR